MFGTVALVSVVWVLYGYSIAFSTANMKAGDYNLNSFFGTLVNGGLSEISIFSSTGNYPASVFITFHMMFAAGRSVCDIDTTIKTRLSRLNS